ncbi:transporter substrate-binding domain-containing protein [Erwinia pyri]|uniref:Transporter substrate-binding domain-containing protein n=1 Tax=Erwinia pyri TaxID=3062598 RepID=A0AA50HMS1_9GAMM|nr:transporter substrate-binding domain-containing protein [Erwinia sp. DE2]WLS79656.1 transporter substrate-binding domain-containing protein [Erwinia sp. DE2]
MNKHRALLTLSLLVMTPVITHADTLEDIKSRGVLTVGIKNDYPPYGFMNAEGKTVGFEVDLARAIAADLLGSPDKIKLVPVNASNRIQFLQSGQIDLIMATLGITPEREKEIDFTDQYVLAAGPSVLARKEAKFNQWEQLKNQKVCGIQGSYYNKTLTQKYSIQLVNFTALPEAYRALQDNRCVAMVFDDITLQNKLGEPGWSGYKIAITPYEYQPMAGGLRKGDDAFKKAVNAAIVKTEGENKLVEWQTTYHMPPSDYIAKRAEAARAAK